MASKKDIKDYSHIEFNATDYIRTIVPMRIESLDGTITFDIVAEDLAKSKPELTGKTQFGTMGFDRTAVSSIHLAATNELVQRVALLESLVADLMAKK